MKISVVIPTRGDVDMAPVVASLARFDEVIIWDNSKRDDLAVYGRYEAISEARNDLILTQDDDCILAPESFDALLAAYQPGHVVCNMPERFRPNYPDSGLVGFGALFERDLPAHAFARFEGPPRIVSTSVAAEQARQERRTLFLRECDAIFTVLTPRILVDVPYADREFASDPSRLWKQPGHVAARARMLNLARQVRDAVPA